MHPDVHLPTHIHGMKEVKGRKEAKGMKEWKKNHGNDKCEAIETNCVHPIAFVICDQPGPGLASLSIPQTWIIYKLFSTNSCSNIQWISCHYKTFQPMSFRLHCMLPVYVLCVQTNQTYPTYFHNFFCYTGTTTKIPHTLYVQVHTYAYRIPCMQPQRKQKNQMRQ